MSFRFQFIRNDTVNFGLIFTEQRDVSYFFVCVGPFQNDVGTATCIRCDTRATLHSSPMNVSAGSNLPHSATSLPVTSVVSANAHSSGNTMVVKGLPVSGSINKYSLKLVALPPDRRELHV